MKFKNGVIGRRFGRLLALEYTEIKRQVRCICDCGKEKLAMRHNLLSGATTSCNCYRNEQGAKSRITHGMTRTPIYWTWRQMLGRCYWPAHTNFKYYGGRGIEVCDRWRYSFENFYADMGDRPTIKHQLDRIDNNKSYCKENCRWATMLEQQHNRSNVKKYELNGEIHILPEWAVKLSIPLSTLWNRIRMGWSIEDVLTRPLQKHKKRKEITPKNPACME